MLTRDLEGQMQNRPTRINILQFFENKTTSQLQLTINADTDVINISIDRLYALCPLLVLLS